MQISCIEPGDWCEDRCGEGQGCAAARGTPRPQDPAGSRLWTRRRSARWPSRRRSSGERGGFFQQQDYSQGLYVGARTLVDTLAQKWNVSLAGIEDRSFAYSPRSARESTDRSSGGTAGGLLLIVLGSRNRGGGRRAGGPGSYWWAYPVIFNRGGGTFGGGGWNSSGWSGGSSGGDWGGFGGGSSGGGGASDSW